MDKQEIVKIKGVILNEIYNYMKDRDYVKIKDIYSDALNVEQYLWVLAVEQTIEDGLVTGITNAPVLGGLKSYKIGPDVALTSKGLDYLDTLTMKGKIKEAFKKGKSILKEIKDTTPGL